MSCNEHPFDLPCSKPVGGDLDPVLLFPDEIGDAGEGLNDGGGEGAVLDMISTVVGRKVRRGG